MRYAVAKKKIIGLNFPLMVLENKVWIPLVAVAAALAAGLVLTQSGSADDFGSVVATPAHRRVLKPAASADPDEALATLLAADATEDTFLKEDEREASDMNAVNQPIDNPDQLFHDITY